MMTELETIEAQLKELIEESRALQKKIDALSNKKAELLSLAYIKEHNITPDDVEFLDGEGMPYFSILFKWAQWLAANSTKRFCEWNNRVYLTGDVINQNLPDSVCRVNDLRRQR